MAFSVERLVHFQCSGTSCGGWWTIGDAPLNRNYFCPWCGTLQLAEDLYKEATQIKKADHEERK